VTWQRYAVEAIAVALADRPHLSGAEAEKIFKNALAAIRDTFEPKKLTR
jgi:hypothetical protein